MTDVERNVVAIATLATPIDAEAKALAADLGTIAYEERMKLAGGLPAIVLLTVDGDAAEALAAKLRARKHRVRTCRASDVVAAGAMTKLRHFQVTASSLDAGGSSIAWSSIGAFVQARHTILNETTETVKEEKFDIGRAVLTGGLIMSKTKTREVTTRTEDTENVLYVFPADGGMPMLMRERSTNYAALGTSLAPIAAKNFATAVALFRGRAPQAKFDDSLVRRRVPDIDLVAHLIGSAG